MVAHPTEAEAASAADHQIEAEAASAEADAPVAAVTSVEEDKQKHNKFKSGCRFLMAYIRFFVN